MKTLKDIIEDLKDVLSRDLRNEGKDERILDKHVAILLNLNPVSFATMKSRNKIPYEEIMEFCARCHANGKFRHTFLKILPCSGLLIKFHMTRFALRLTETM